MGFISKTLQNEVSAQKGSTTIPPFKWSSHRCAWSNTGLAIGIRRPC